MEGNISLCFESDDLVQIFYPLSSPQRSWGGSCGLGSLELRRKTYPADWDSRGAAGSAQIGRP